MIVVFFTFYALALIIFALYFFGYGAILKRLLIRFFLFVRSVLDIRSCFLCIVNAYIKALEILPMCYMCASFDNSGSALTYEDLIQTASGSASRSALCADYVGAECCISCSYI